MGVLDWLGCFFGDGSFFSAQLKGHFEIWVVRINENGSVDQKTQFFTSLLFKNKFKKNGNGKDFNQLKLLEIWTQMSQFYESLSYKNLYLIAKALHVIIRNFLSKLCAGPKRKSTCKNVQKINSIKAKAQSYPRKKIVIHSGLVNFN